MTCEFVGQQPVVVTLPSFDGQAKNLYNENNGGVQRWVTEDSTRNLRNR